MEGILIPVDDGYGIVGYHYACTCGNITVFINTAEIICSSCGFSEICENEDEY